MLMVASALTDVVQWDVATWGQAVRFWERSVTLRGRCLEVGARDGGLALWMASRGGDVLCSDLWGSERRARPLHERYGVTMTYEDIDATAIPYRHHFDCVAFKSLLGGLGTANRQRAAMRSIYDALRPGGYLLFAENLTASWLHRYARSRLRDFLWRDVALRELREMVAPYSTVCLQTTGVLAAFGTTEYQRRLLAWADRVVVPFCPPRWRYVAYGFARK
jgi:SAM-dependent methyltransferase